MNDRTGFSGTDLLLAMLGGAAAGAAIALLVAPRSGRETRAAIGDAFRDGKDKARHVPPAVKAGARAAREAFVDAMHEGNAV